MTSENPDTRRELPEVPPPRHIAGPVLCSVVLHSVVLLLFSRTISSMATDANVAEARQSVGVTLAMRAPPMEAAPPALESAESVPSESVDVPEAEPAEPGLVADAVPVQAPEPLEAEISGESTGATGATIEAWTPARIRAAVQTSSGELRSALTRDWTQDCFLEKKERHTRDCEEQRQQQDILSANATAGRAAGLGAFASVTRPDRQWLLAEQFKKDNNLLRGLLDDDGVLGELATTRYYLNRDYIIYLSGNRVNGNHNDMVFAPMQNFAADVLGGPRLLLNGDFPFQCRSRKKVEYDVDLVTSRVTGGNVVPCIYDYTGFEIVRPEPEPEPDPNAFRVVPVVPGSER